jgi:CheY-like chemotaxis protein
LKDPLNSNHQRIGDNLESIQGSIESIKQALNTSLSMERMKIGDRTLNIFQFRLSDIFTHILRTYESHAQVKGIDFHWEIDSVLLHQDMLGDLEKIALIVRRFLDNAMHSVERGGFVFLRCSLLNNYLEEVVDSSEEKLSGGYMAGKQNEGSQSLDQVSACSTILDETIHHHMRIEVEDNSHGLQASNISSLFKEYETAGSQSPERKNSRKGLVACKLKAEAMGGSVGVSLSRHQSSLFYATLPLYFEEEDIPLEVKSRVKNIRKRKSKQKDHRSRSSSAGIQFHNIQPVDVLAWQHDGIIEPKSPKETNILVCEEIPSFRAFISSSLKGLGVNVREEPNSSSILKHIKQKEREGNMADIDLLVLDEGFWGKEGKDALIELRREGCSLPILMTTTSPVEENDIYSLLANDVIIKPFTEEELIAALSHYIILS